MEPVELVAFRLYGLESNDAGRVALDQRLERVGSRTERHDPNVNDVDRRVLGDDVE